MHELPLWLASCLAERQIVDFGQPKVFSNKALNDIRADSLFQSLHDSCPHFYKFGFKILQIGDLEAVLLTIVLCFAERLEELVKRVFAFPSDRTSSFFQKLDFTERDSKMNVNVNWIECEYSIYELNEIFINTFK